MRMPATAENPSETYVRQATIPHGDSLVAQSTSFTTVPGGPRIDPVNSFPFPLGDPIPPLNDVTHPVNTDPFVVRNANATQMDAIFWIEKVTHPGFPARIFLQLQYVQRVILDFVGLHWPHVSVATLIKTA